MRGALLPDRAVVRVAGADARKFLNGLLTADLARVTPSAPAYAALLTPQGKIIADFIVVEADASDGGGFYLDAPRALVATLVQRLTFYKLRAQIAITAPEALGVLALWDGAAAASDFGLLYPDPRLPALGSRMILPAADAAEACRALGATFAREEDYEAHRLALGIPRGGVDFVYGDAFPHEAGLDQLHGVSFDKGCYVGQEVVSRMQHRGTARTRLARALTPASAPEPGASIMAGDKTIGTMGSSVGGLGLALIRLDRAADAIAAGIALQAGGLPVHLEKPAWAQFAWPLPPTAPGPADAGP